MNPKAEDASTDDVIHFSVSPRIFYMLLAAAFTGGGGFGSFVAPQLDKNALESCYNTSSQALTQATTALSVVGDQSKELNFLREENKRLESLIFQQTQGRWTAEQQEEYERNDRRHEDAQDRDIESLKRREGK